jgi:hypothetical protein
VRRRKALRAETLCNLEETLACLTTALLQQFFDGHIAGRGIWSPRSSDLTQPDIFLWIFLKEKVYSKNPQSSEELEHNTEQTVANNDQEILRKISRNTHTKRMDLIFESLWIISASALRLFCKFFLTKTRSKSFVLLQ